ncbi:MAG: hypothetical protein ACK559_28615 [bacterium]
MAVRVISPPLLAILSPELNDRIPIPDLIAVTPVFVTLPEPVDETLELK